MFNGHRKRYFPLLRSDVKAVAEITAFSFTSRVKILANVFSCSEKYLKFLCGCSETHSVEAAGMNVTSCVCNESLTSAFESNATLAPRHESSVKVDYIGYITTPLFFLVGIIGECLFVIPPCLNCQID